MNFALRVNMRPVTERFEVVRDRRFAVRVEDVAAATGLSCAAARVAAVELGAQHIRPLNRSVLSGLRSREHTVDEALAYGRRLRRPGPKGP